jgi:coproporphyrinogen III oxidase
MSALSDTQKNAACDFFAQLQDRLIHSIARVDGNSEFIITPWERPEGGGGATAVLRGEVVEKAGVNRSRVMGTRYPALESEHSGKPFFAAGISTISHLSNPFAPIGHMNVRLLEVGETFWVGGGADLTPCFPFEEDTRLFHETLRRACDQHPCGGLVSYDKFSKWCDEYFYIPHRKSVRGVGGVFFDYLKGSFDELFAFIQAVGNAYAEVYPTLIERRKVIPFTEEEREKLLYWRGRYAEYNLIYDRGTKFGLMTGGNTDSIFVSLPPVVKW